MLVFTVIDKGLTFCCASTAETVPLVNMALKVYHNSHKLHCDETNISLFTEPYHKEVFSTQNIRSEFFGKTFSLNFLPWESFHLVVLTAVDERLTFCFLSTATTVQTGKKSGTQYDNDHTFDGDETKLYLLNGVDTELCLTGDCLFRMLLYQAGDSCSECRSLDEFVYHVLWEVFGLGQLSNLVVNLAFCSFKVYCLDRSLLAHL